MTSKIPTLSYRQKKHLTAVAYKLMTRRWLATLEPPPDRVMGVLLMHVVISAEQGCPMNKKDAWKSLGIEDVRTGRKYITRAQQLGFLEVTRSDKDRRKELLLPSPLLRRAMEQELQLLTDDLKMYSSNPVIIPDDDWDPIDVENDVTAEITGLIPSERRPGVRLRYV
jgi:hypothetical protein